MKFCRVVFLFALLCSGWSLAQTPTTVPDGGMTFRDPQYGYSLRLPAGSLYWDSDSLKSLEASLKKGLQAGTQSGNLRCLIQLEPLGDPEELPPRLSVVVEALPGDSKLSPMEWVRSVGAARVERDLGATVAWRAYGTTMVSGKEFSRMSYSWRPFGYQVLYCRSYTFFDENRSSIITVSLGLGMLRDTDQELEKLEGLFHSLQFEDDSASPSDPLTP